MLGNSNIDEVEIKIEVLTDKNGRFDHPLRENSVFPRQKKVILSTPILCAWWLMVDRRM